MVVVKIELWPNGDESQARPIGEMRIINDGTGNIETGNYNVELRHAGKFYGRPGNWKTGKVCGFVRSFSPYHLVARSLRVCGII